MPSKLVIRARRQDGNHADLREKALQIPGLSWLDTHALPKFVDAVVGFRGTNFLIEIKDPSRPRSRRKLTPAQIELHAQWQGQIDVVETLDDLLKVLHRSDNYREPKPLLHP